MRFYEFATTKPKKLGKPPTPERSVVAARTRDVDQAATLRVMTAMFVEAC